jgi:hypothetical protein
VLELGTNLVLTTIGAVFQSSGNQLPGPSLYLMSEARPRMFECVGLSSLAKAKVRSLGGWPFDRGMCRAPAVE